MRILVLLTDAYGSIGGIAKYNRDLLKALSAYPGCSAVVAIPMLGEIQQEAPIPVKVHYVTLGINSRLKYILTAFKTVFLNSRFDLIICGHINLIPLAIAFKYLLKCQTVLTVHGIEAWRPTRNILINLAVRKIDAFLSVSELTKKRFCRWSGLQGRKGYILPNCIDLETFKPGPKNQALVNRYNLQNKKVIFTLARLNSKERYKGIDEILVAMPDLLKEIPNLVYMIGGDGDDKKRLEGKAKSLRLQECVIFTGFISETEKADHYRLSNAYVMPGRGEGFGIVYLEALACGIPILIGTSDAGVEILKNTNCGVIADSNNPCQIRRAIYHLIQNEPRNALFNAVERFSCQLFEAKCHEILRLLTSG